MIPRIDDDLPVIHFNLSEQELDYLKNLILTTDIILNDANKDLVGQIETQFYLEEKWYPSITRIMMPAIELHISKSPYFNRMIHGNTRIKLSECWVNLQKKYEYNPPHAHNGIFSFVIWISIPYLKEEESKFKNTAKSTDHLNGDFYFIFHNNHTQTFGIKNIPADKTYEGQGVFFPSHITHGVNPFYTSDDQRISIAGNYAFDFSQPTNNSIEIQVENKHE